MNARPSLAPLAVLLVACGPDPVVHAELEEVCGAPSPVRVLELAPDQVVRAGETVRVQDRVVYVVSRLDPLDADEPYSSTEESTVWSAGPCGESPVQLASSIEDIFTVDIWPDLVLGCEEATGNVVVLDPTGVAAPHVAFPGVSQFPYSFGCGFAWTDHGLLSLQEHDEEFAALLLHPFPADPQADVSIPEVLLDGVRIGPSSGGGLGTLADLLYTFKDHVLALTPADEVVRVELADRSVSTLQTGVVAFATAPPYAAPKGGRFLLWQDATVTQDDPHYPVGEVFLRDLGTGNDTLLAETSLRWTFFEPLFWEDHNQVRLHLDNPTDAGSQQRIFFLPELDSVDIPGDLHLYGPLDDGRWLGEVLNPWSDTFLELVELPSGERTRLFPREAEYDGRDGDAVRVLEVPQCCIDSDFRAEGPLWRVLLDDGAPTQLATRATRHMTYTSDDLLIGAVAAGARWLATLVVIDTATRAESRIDEYVHYYSIDTTRVHDERIISYSVADGDRSGVYLAKLPPAAGSRSTFLPPRGPDLAYDLVRDRDGRIVPRPRPLGVKPLAFDRRRP